MSEPINWSNYLSGNECWFCHLPIEDDQQWVNCDGWAEHQACHDGDVES